MRHCGRTALTAFIAIPDLPNNTGARCCSCSDCAVSLFCADSLSAYERCGRASGTTALLRPPTAAPAVAGEVVARAVGCAAGADGNASLALPAIVVASGTFLARAAAIGCGAALVSDSETAGLAEASCEFAAVADCCACGIAGAGRLLATLTAAAWYPLAARQYCRTSPAE